MIPALALHNLHKSFAGVPAVRDLTLTIEPGEIFGLLGPNGAGKSTTINMIAGVTRIGAGSVKIFGYDNLRDYLVTRRLTGVMHQEIIIDHFFTIDRAIRIHAGYYGIADDPAWRVELIDRLGLGPHLHKPMNKLSGGLKRRFMIAKALIHKPRLLILDEPTAGVDVELRHTLWEFVRDINRRGTTVLLTTHYLEEAEQMCDRIAIMNDGNLIALDRTSRLLSSLGHRRLRLELATPLLSPPEGLGPFSPLIEDGGRTLVLTLPSGTPDGEALKALYAHGLDVLEIETEQAGLEEVFLELTGIKGKGRGRRHEQ